MDSLHISGLSGNVVASDIDAVHQFAIAGTNHKVNALSLRWLGQASASIGGRIVADIKNGKMFQMASRGAAVFGTPAFSELGVTCRPQLNFKAGEHQGLDLVSVDMEDDAGRKSHWGAAPGHEPQPPSMPRQASLGPRQLIHNPLVARQLAFQASSNPSSRASAVVGSQTPARSVPDNGALPLPPRLAPRGPRQQTNHPRAASELMPQATRLLDLKSTSFLGGHISVEPWAGSDLPAVPPKTPELALPAVPPKPPELALPAVPPKPPELALPAVPPKPPELALPAVPPKPPELALPAVPPKPPELALPAVPPKPTQENAHQIATTPAKIGLQQLIEKLRAETVPRR